MQSYYPNLWPRKLVPQEIPVPGENNKKKVAYITGITGQDGLHLTSHLLFSVQDIDYDVYGIVRKNSAGIPMLMQFQDYLSTLPQLRDRRKLVLLYGDITDSQFITYSVGKS
jgi:GDPmannose 4,6-dehydratase